MNGDLNVWFLPCATPNTSWDLNLRGQPSLMYTFLFFLLLSNFRYSNQFLFHICAIKSETLKKNQNNNKNWDYWLCKGKIHFFLLNILSVLNICGEILSIFSFMLFYSFYQLADIIFISERNKSLLLHRKNWIIIIWTKIKEKNTFYNLTAQIWTIKLKKIRRGNNFSWNDET